MNMFPHVAAMGWSSDWALGCGTITDDQMYWEGEQMARHGLVAAGYTTLIFECGWEIGYEDDWSPKVSGFFSLLKL
jgi:hypothetical protein